MRLQAHERMLGVRGFDGTSQGHPPVVRYLIASIPAIQLKTYAQTYSINSFPKGSVMLDLAQDRLIFYKDAIAWIPGDQFDSELLQESAGRLEVSRTIALEHTSADLYG